MASDIGKNFSKEKGEILQWLNSKASKRRIGTTKRNLKIFQPNSPDISAMGNRDKDKENSDTGTIGEGAESAHDTHQATLDLSCKRATAIDKQVAEAITRESPS